ncbi:FYN-binding protein 2 [Loxodonta africana]|uniref:FYN-binding protein 2 n=1 Tax=Loxodonta africana TaxID=9785 RepID=UPI0030CF3E57
MEGEGVRNFKELRAKFQNMLDAPVLPGPIKFPAGVPQKDDITSAQSTQVLATGKTLSSNQNQPSPYCSSNEPQPLTPQKMELAQNSKVQKCSNSPTPLKGSAGSAVNSQKASLLSEIHQSNDEVTDKEKVKMTYNFRDKLWNWEKFSSQKSETSPAILLANRGGRALHLEEQKSMGRFPEKPRKKLETNEAQTFPSQRHLMAQKKSLASSEDSSFLLSQHNRKSPENSGPERKPALSTSPPIYECELASQVTEKQQDIRHHQLPKTKPLPSVKSLGPPPPKPPKPPVVNLQAFQKQAAAVPEMQREETIERGSVSSKCMFFAEFEEPHNYEATISYLRLSGNSINLCTAKEIADCKSAKPINIVTLCGMKLSKAGTNWLSLTDEQTEAQSNEAICLKSHRHALEESSPSRTQTNSESGGGVMKTPRRAKDRMLGNINIHVGTPASGNIIVETQGSYTYGWPDTDPVILKQTNRIDACLIHFFHLFHLGLSGALSSKHSKLHFFPGIFPCFSPKHEGEDKKMKENEPCQLESQKIEKNPHVSHLFKMGAYEGTPGKLQKTDGHKGKRTMLAEKQDCVTGVIQTKGCPEDTKLARHTQGHCGYVEALEVTKEAPDQGAFMPSSTAEETYDDVECSERESLDGNETLKRLRQFFKKEKDRFKMKKAKPKENVSEFSISLPDLEFRSQEVIIYDDVDIPERKSKEEDKLKTWKTKFLIPKENKGKKSAEESESLSPRNFFRFKKQNLEKKMDKEEKLFRERFEYDKEITVINTAVACSSNSRKGIFDLPITPGEELEVIDITEQNLVICRNSEGKCIKAGHLKKTNTKRYGLHT